MQPVLKLSNPPVVRYPQTSPPPADVTYLAERNSTLRAPDYATAVSPAKNHSFPYNKDAEEGNLCEIHRFHSHYEMPYKTEVNPALTFNSNGEGGTGDIVEQVYLAQSTVTLDGNVEMGSLPPDKLCALCESTECALSKPTDDHTWVIQPLEDDPNLGNHVQKAKAPTTKAELLALTNPGYLPQPNNAPIRRAEQLALTNQPHQSDAGEKPKSKWQKAAKVNGKVWSLLALTDQPHPDTSDTKRPTSAQLSLYDDPVTGA